MNKYLEYYNDNFVLSNEINNLKSREINALNLFSKNDNLKHDLEKDAYSVFLDNKWYKFKLLKITNSGIKDNNEKRIQIGQKWKYEADILYIGWYDSGNQFCFVYFDEPKIFDINVKTNNSIWINYKNIFYTLESKENNYVMASNKTYGEYKQFFSLNLCEILLNINSFKYKNISSNKYDEIFHSKLNTKFDPFDQTDLQSSIDKYAKKFENVSKEIGRYSEAIFDYLINHKKSYIESNIGNNINSYVWENELKESFKPYDFLINSNIYIDIKGTHDHEHKFYMSDKEKKFIEDLNDKEYFLVSIIGVKTNNMQIKFYNKHDVLNFDWKIDKYHYHDKGQ